MLPIDVVGLTTGVVSITTGAHHTCALTSSGGLKCWGSNSWGSLGDGTSIDRLTPINVSGLSSNVRAVSAGYYHTCAITIPGGVKCFGRNQSGQLGDGTITHHTATPVDVIGLSSEIIEVTAGYWHNCALTVSGGVKCWGGNSNGQLGDGTSTDSITPVDVIGLTSGVVSIAAGANHTCALLASGGVKCWGSAPAIGDGTAVDRLTPVDVIGLTSGVASISSGASHTCALTIAGAVKCWGSNYYGRLGDNTTTDRLSPVNVIGF